MDTIECNFQRHYISKMNKRGETLEQVYAMLCIFSFKGGDLHSSE